MILQLHKFQVELEESKQKNAKQTEKITGLEQKNEERKNEINELTKTKERLTEQSGFFQKSLNKKKAENAELLERLKLAEIQLGESGSVLATVRNLESKNEILSEKMSSVLLNTEEEIAKAKTDRGRYIKLQEETIKLNKRNVEIQNELSEARETGQHYAKQAAVRKYKPINVQHISLFKQNCVLALRANFPRKKAISAENDGNSLLWKIFVLTAFSTSLILQRKSSVTCV